MYNIHLGSSVEQEISEKEAIDRMEKFFLKNCCLVLNFWSRLYNLLYMRIHIDNQQYIYRGGAKVGIQLYHISEISGILYRSESNIS